MKMVSRYQKTRSLSAAKLRRARRLYAYLIYESAIQDHDTLVRCAIRAQEHGLYAETTGIRQVCFGLASHLFKLTRRANPDLQRYQSWRGWHNFWDDFDHLFEFSKPRYHWGRHFEAAA